MQCSTAQYATQIYKFCHIFIFSYYPPLMFVILIFKAAWWDWLPCKALKLLQTKQALHRLRSTADERYEEVNLNRKIFVRRYDTSSISNYCLKLDTKLGVRVLLFLTQYPQRSMANFSCIFFFVTFLLSILPFRWALFCFFWKII
jgi:hypothetical protein